MSNPIIGKEVISALRTRKAAAVQALFLLAVAFLIWRLWPEGGMQALAGTQSRRLLSVLAVCELLLVAMFAPAFTAGSLTLEREKNTLESLMATAMKPWEIAWGKMAGCLAFLLLLVASGVPALAAPFLLGGVPGRLVLTILGLLVLTALYLGMIGLTVSSVMHRSYRSIIVTYAILLGVCFLVALPAWPLTNYLISYGPDWWRGFLHVLASLSPLEAMFSLVWPESPYSVGVPFMPPFWQVYIVVSLAVIVVTSLVLLAKLCRPIAPPRPREKLKIVERGKVTARSFLFLIDPRKRKRMIRWWQNPILTKEFRTRPMLQGQWLMRAVGVCLIVSVLLMMTVGGSVTLFIGQSADMLEGMGAAVGAMMVVLVMLIGPAITGGTICSDRESGVWELIRSTRLPSWRIVSGKFQASVIPLLLVVLAMAPSLVLLIYFEYSLVKVYRILYVVGMTVLFVATAGMFFSSIFSRTSAATAWTYAVVLSLGLLGLVAMLGKDLFSPGFLRGIYILNPVAATMDAAGNAAMSKLGLLIPHLKIMGATTAAMFVITVVRVFHLRRPD